MLSPNTEELAGELVAFANAEGGAVFLGVDDSGGVRGIPPESLDAAEHWLLNVATHNCEPPIRPVVRKALLPSDRGVDDRILLMVVPRGLYVHRTSGGRYYTTSRVHQTRPAPRRSSLGSSSNGAASTYSTSSPCRPPPWTT